MASTLVCPFLLLQLALHRDCSLPCSLAASGLVYLLVQHQVVVRQSVLHRLHLQHSHQSRLAASTLVCPLLLEWQLTTVLQLEFLRLHQLHPLHLLALPPPLKGSGHRALLPSPQPLLFSLESSSLSRGLTLPALPLLPPLRGSGHRASLPSPQPLLISLGNSSLSNSCNIRGLALPPLILSPPLSLFEGSGRRDSPPSFHLLQCHLSLT